MNDLNVTKETTILVQITLVNTFLLLYEHKTIQRGYV